MEGGFLGRWDGSQVPLDVSMLRLLDWEAEDPFYASPMARTDCDKPPGCSRGILLATPPATCANYCRVE